MSALPQVDLKALATLLDFTTAPDRHLDALLWDIVDPRPRFAVNGDAALYKQDPGEEVQFDCAPEYTADLNLACALLQKIFPGREVDLMLKTDLTACEVILWHPDDLLPNTVAELVAEPSEKTGRAKGPAAIAVCHAIVLALIAEQKTTALAA